MDEALAKVSAAIEAVQKLVRNREVSVAITHLETAELWLKKNKEA